MLPMTQVKVMTGVGAILVLLCSIFLGVFPVIFNSIVDKMLVVRNDSEVFDAFVSPPVPIYMQFWLFNVTNPDEIRFNGAKPVLKEIGPFTYEEVRVKYYFNWDADEGTVSYLQNKSYLFREDLSNGLKETDHVTTINVLMVSLAAGLVQNPALLVLLELLFLRFNQTLFVTRAVGDLLFRGYPEPLLVELTKLFGDPRGNNGRFGIFYPVNNTDDKRYEVKTGANGMDNFLNIVKWNGNETLPYWHGPNDQYCNMINGTDGSQYPPRITRDTVLYIYTSELCRSLYLTYEKDLYHHGIPVYRFVPPPEVLEDPEINHDNLCYCFPDRAHCLGAGMLNLQPCLGLPLILSTPHFYQGDEEELAKLVGLNPSKADHETIIDVEPRTGVAMSAAKKMQLNMPLKPYGSLPSFKNVPEVIFPILWVNESAVVDEESARQVKNAVFVPFVVVDAICGCLIAVGALLLLVGGYKFLHIKPECTFMALHSTNHPENLVKRAANQQKL